MGKLKELGNNIDIINNTALEVKVTDFPYNAEEIIKELRNPITVKILIALVKN